MVALITGPVSRKECGLLFSGYKNIISVLAYLDSVRLHHVSDSRKEERDEDKKSED